MGNEFNVDLIKNWYSCKIQGEIELMNCLVIENEILISKGMNFFKEGKETKVEENNGFHYNVNENYLCMDSSAFDLDDIFKEYFPNIKRQSILIMIMSLIEKELITLCATLKGKQKLNLQLNNLNRSKGTLEGIKDYLLKVVNLTILNEANWDKLVVIYKLRNNIVHNFGKYQKKEESTNRFINLDRNISINVSNEIILDKGFLEGVLILFTEISREIENSIQNKFYKIS